MVIGPDDDPFDEEGWMAIACIILVIVLVWLHAFSLALPALLHS